MAGALLETKEREIGTQGEYDRLKKKTRDRFDRESIGSVLDREIIL